MAITPIDYAGMLAKKNADTRVQIDKLKKSYDEGLQSAEDLAHEKTKKQRNIYYKDRADLEKNMSENIADIREATTQENKALKHRLKKKIDARDMEHADSLRKKSDQYRQKIESMRDVYDNSKGQAAKWSDSSKKDAIASVQKKMKALQRSHSRDLEEKDITQDMQNRLFREKLADDRKKMARNFQQKVDQLTSGKKKDISDFRTRLDGIQKDYNKSLKNIEDKTRIQDFNRVAKHKNDREKIEGEMNAALHRIKVDQKDLLAKKSDMYKDALLKQTKDSQVEFEKNRSNHAKEMIKVKDSFTAALRDRDRQHDMIKDQAEKRFRLKYDSQAKDHEDSTQKIIDNAAEAAQLVKKDFSEKRRMQNINHAKELKEFRDEASVAKSEVIDKFQKQIKDLNEVHKNESEIREYNNSRNIASLKDKHRLAGDNHRMTYERTMKALQENSKRQKKRISLDNTRRVKELERKQVAETAYLKQQIANAAENDPSKAGTRANFEKQQIEDSYINKINNLKNSMADSKRNLVEEKALQVTKFNDAMKKKDAEALAVNEARDKESSEYLHEKNQKFVKERNALIANYKNKLTEVTSNTDRYIRSETQKFQNEMKRKAQENEIMVNDLIKRNKDTVDTMRKNHRMTKNKIIKASSDRSNQELSDMQKENMIRLNQEKESFDNIIASTKWENKRNIDKLEKKLRNSQEKSNNEIRRVHAAAEEQINDQLIDSRNAMEEARLDFKQRVQRIRIAHDKKIQKLKYESDKAMEELQNQTDKKLIDQRLEMVKETKKRVSHAEARYRHLAKMSEIEKESIRAQYEKRIEKMRQAHKEELKQKIVETKSMFI